MVDYLVLNNPGQPKKHEPNLDRFSHIRDSLNKPSSAHGKDIGDLWKIPFSGHCFPLAFHIDAIAESME